MRLEGKVALITGAAAAVEGELMGFGGASAWLFVREGAKVVLADIKDALGEKSAAQMREQGYDAMYIHLDVTSEQDWADAIKTTVSTFGRLDILVNNAGTGARQTVEETTEEIWDAQMNVHAKGVFLGTKHAIPEMRKVGGGSIINISSIYGLVGSPTSTAYHAAKGAIRIFTKAAAIQYARDNIRVNSVHPGYAETPLTVAGFADTERRNWMLGRIPMGRFGNAMDIAPGILYLASDESSYMTGAELVIDGGVTAQ
ncbi:MAG: glucose 1-dehydrogenase [Chloroflexi bacterium]|nr:glucose 1-dehydrogenase [Chloroflexota bacterium]